MIDLHHDNEDVEMEAYMFVGFTKDGRMIMHIPEDMGESAYLLLLMQKAIYDNLSLMDQGYLQ